VDEKTTYSHLFPALYRYFFYKQVQRDSIEDLCQESFMRFFQKYDSTQFTELDCAKILYGIARNVYREWVRRAIRDTTFELNEDMAITDSFADFLLDIDDAAEEFNTKLLDEALGTLSETFQKVLRMRFILGMSRAQVAEELGVKEKHVHVYQRRALVALRQELVKMELNCIPTDINIVKDE
jgi:RNA polymerase sigma factor (sigma-70 family)